MILLLGTSLDNEMIFCILGFPYMLVLVPATAAARLLLVAALAANGFPDIVRGLVNGYSVEIIDPLAAC